ncbi:TPA: type II secretion system protein E [Candidatus Bathyarchaeota archaeon]|nr:type II secretion system protein E [Candidatus Bathyarchaeota archaeon]
MGAYTLKLPKIRFPKIGSSHLISRLFGGRPEIPISRGHFKVEPLIAVFEGEVLDRYTIDQATVFIVENEGVGYYIICEPKLSQEEKAVYSLLMENLYYSLKPVSKVEDPLRYVESFIWEAAEDLGLLNRIQESFQKYKYYISRDAFGYGPIHVPMRDPDVEEVSLTSYMTPVTVIHRRYTEYDWLETNIRFGSEDELRTFIQRIAQRAGKSVTVAVPFTDAMTREGHRIAVTFGSEVTLPGSTLAIRKFPEDPYTMAHLLKFGTLTPLMASYLWLLVEFRGFIMVLGPTGSGKTTLANCLLTLVNPALKIASIEDTPELKIPHRSWQRFKARHTYSITESRYDIDLLDLVKLSLRYRPDYVVVGEVRGEEVRALIQASALGHGCICTIHADSPEAALIRMKSPPMNVAEGGLMLIWCFVGLNRVKMRNGKVVRRVLDIKEVKPKSGKTVLKPIFEWKAETDVYIPSRPDDIVENSYRLRAVKRLTGWSNSRLREELEERAAFLWRALEEEKLSYPQFSAEIRRFYLDSRRHGE